MNGLRVSLEAHIDAVCIPSLQANGGQIIGGGDILMQPVRSQGGSNPSRHGLLLAVAR
jgi:hypothetical protein